MVILSNICYKILYSRYRQLASLSLLSFYFCIITITFCLLLFIITYYTFEILIINKPFTFENKNITLHFRILNIGT